MSVRNTLNPSAINAMTPEEARSILEKNEDLYFIIGREPLNPNERFMLICRSFNYEVEDDQ